MTKVEQRHMKAADEALGGAEVLFQGEYQEALEAVAQALADAEARGAAPTIDAVSLTNLEQQQLAIVVAAQALRSLPDTVRGDALAAMGYAEQQQGGADDDDPTCVGEWLSGSGGHRMFSGCGKPATWVEHGTGAAFCDAHFPVEPILRQRQGGAGGREYASESIWRELNGLYEIAKAAWALRTSTEPDAAAKLDEALDFFAEVATKARADRMAKEVPFPTIPAKSRQQQTWVPCSERLPETLGEYVQFVVKGEKETLVGPTGSDGLSGFYFDAHRRRRVYFAHEVSVWAPLLPPPPAEVTP